MTREQAYQILTEYTKNPNLIKHALAVEAGMRAYAKKFGQDEGQWSIVGLLHDFDYEIHPTPDLHPQKGSEILRQKGVSEEIIRAILSHADHTGVPRQTLMEKTLFACDELCGFITAVALVRPSKKIAEVEVGSVKKKFKDKPFARQVSREDMQKGAEELGVPIEEHIDTVLKGMQAVAADLGL
ncbi:MAG: HAD family hydrolase [candidate division Zixibacteria bacterium RBG_16_50_21]|nr:MAG: HAD family hydrolase [candidate division Zixibacteria bacterium RBG_16_50_21]